MREHTCTSKIMRGINITIIGANIPRNTIEKKINIISILKTIRKTAQA